MQRARALSKWSGSLASCVGLALVTAATPARAGVPRPTPPALELQPGDGERNEGDAPVEVEPAPRWIKAGLGSSAALTLLSGSIALAYTLRTLPGGDAEDEVRDAAQGTLTDGNPNNDIRPNQSLENICSRSSRSAQVKDACDAGAAQRRTAVGAWTATGVFALSTVVFSTVLAVNRHRARAAAELDRRQVQLGVGASPSSVVVSGAFRF